MSEFVPPRIIDGRGDNVVDFPDPFVHHVFRRCCLCGGSVRVDLVGGASEPREATYRCPDCRRSEPATDAVLEQSRPQLAIVEKPGG